MARKKDTQPIVLGFVGSGEVSEKEAQALLDDFIGDNEDVTFVIPVTKEAMTDTMEAVFDYATNVDPPIRVEIVTDEVSAKQRTLAKYVKAADKTHQVARIPHKVVSVLGSAEGNRSLVAIWPVDENGEELEDEMLNTACNRALDAGLDVRDLASGMSVVDFSEGGDESAEDTGEDQNEGELPDDAPAADGDAESDEWRPYTRDELEAIGEKDREELKAIAVEDFKLDVPPRTRATTIVDKILAAQEAMESADEPADGGDTLADMAEVLGQPVIDMEAFADAVASAVMEKMRELLRPFIEDVKELAEGDPNGKLAAIEERLEGIEETLQKLSEVAPPEAPASATREDDEPPAPARRRRVPR